MFVWVMGGVTQGCYMTICCSNESLTTLETLVDEARLENSIPAKPFLGQDSVMPHCDDAPPVFWSATICLFGSWVG